MKTIVLSFRIPRLEPGAAHLEKLEPPCAFRAERIVAREMTYAPELRRFLVGVGGSKRRGQRASWLWSSQMLRHARGYKALAIEDLYVGKDNQLMGYVPLEIFAPHFMDNKLCIAPCRHGGVLRIRIRNIDAWRVAEGTLAVLGAEIA